MGEIIMDGLRERPNNGEANYLMQIADALKVNIKIEAI